MCKAPLPSVISLPINLTLLDIITIYAIILRVKYVGFYKYKFGLHYHNHTMN